MTTWRPGQPVPDGYFHRQPAVPRKPSSKDSKSFVHCRDGLDHGEDDGMDLGDGWVWLCLGAIGPMEMPSDALDWYHNALPPARCSCGYDPRPRPPEPDEC